MDETAAHTPNPYLGPIPFQEGQTLYGRERETLDLIDLLIAERIVLLHSPSGAGKTSLVQAALLPKLRQRDFNVLPVGRVGYQAIQDNTGRQISGNRFMQSLLTSLEEGMPAGERGSAHETGEATLSAYLEHLEAQGEGRPLLLIIDQFEEALTVDAFDVEAHQSFFSELGEALEKRNRWALLVMREDYLGALEPYQNRVPTGLSNRFRLDLLGVEAARQAIQSPSRAAGVDFTDEAANQLVNDLRQARVQLRDGSSLAQPGQYIEPVHLQVVCRHLWEQPRVNAGQITLADIGEFSQVDDTLATYYRQVVGQVAASKKVSERALREWFERQLINEIGLRNSVLMEYPTTRGLENDAIRGLIDAYLVREDKRHGLTFFELAHDRLVSPVRDDNANWFKANLNLLQRNASAWQAQGQPQGLLLRNTDLAEGEAWAAANPDELSQADRALLEASGEAQERRRAEVQAVRSRRLLMVAGLIVAAVVVFAIVTLNLRSKALQAESSAKDALSTSVMDRSTATAALATSVIDRKNAGFALATAQQDRATAAAAQATSQVNAQFAQEQFANAQGALSISKLDTNLAQAYLLSVQAYKSQPDSYLARSSLLSSLQKSPRLKRILYGHPGYIDHVAFNPVRPELATSGRDGKIILWNLGTYQARGDLTVAEPDCQFLFAYSPDGNSLATSDNCSNAVKIWDTRTLQPLGDPLFYAGQLITSLAYYPHGKRLFIGRADGRIAIWDTSTRSQVGNTFHAHSISVTSLAFSQDGKLLASASRSADEINIYDLSGWDGKASLRLLGEPLPGHKGGVEDISFSADGNLLASVGSDGFSIIWNIADLIQTGIPTELSSIFAASGAVQSEFQSAQLIALDPSGTLVASTSPNNPVISLENSYFSNWTGLAGHVNPISDLTFSPDGQTLASVSTDGIFLWDMVHASSTLNVYVPTDFLNAELVGWTQDPNLAMLASCLKETTGGCEKTGIEVRNLTNGQTRGRIPVDPYSVYNVYLPPQGRWLYVFTCQAEENSNCASPHIQVWDVRTGARLIETDLNMRGYPTGQLFSNDGRKIALGLRDSGLLLLDFSALDATGPDLRDVLQQVVEQSLADVQALAFSPDGDWLTYIVCVDPSESEVCKKQQVRLWGNLQSQHFDLFSNFAAGVIPAMTFSSDKRHLASSVCTETDDQGACNAESVTFWEISSAGGKTEIQQMEKNPIESRDILEFLALSPDSSLLASIASPGFSSNLRLWDVSTGSQLGSDELLPGYYSQPEFNSDGEMLFVFLRPLPNQEWVSFVTSPKRWVDIICDIVGRNFTQSEWRQFYPGRTYERTCEQWPDGE
jgi:WD40 repeat protein